jgi:glycerate kinase
MDIMKKMIIAPDSFKGSLSATQVCEIISDIARKYFPDTELIQLPVSDGGEGLVDALLSGCGGEKIWVAVHDPLGRAVQSFYGLLKDGRAVIEMAAERDSLTASTFGTGELIKHAIASGVRECILGLGGSATHNGGAGAATALGIRYLDGEGQLILSGRDLHRLEIIDTPQLIPGFKETHFTLATDVTNPLYGPSGAAAIFALQKGASQEQLPILEAGSMRLAELVQAQTGIDLQKIPGSGAAGGLAIPFIAFGNAQVCQGLDVVLDAIQFESHLDGCDLVITGEGRTDAQSSMGKALGGIGQRCKDKSVPVIALSGALDEGYERLYDFGITACFAATRKNAALDEVMADAEDNLARAAEDLFRLIKWVNTQ